MHNVSSLRGLFGKSIYAAAFFLMAAAKIVFAGTLSPAAGGTAISADTSSNAKLPVWTALTGPTYRETVNGDLRVGTVTLTAPAGFEFNTNALINIRLTNGDSVASRNINDVAVGGNIASTTNSTVTNNGTSVTFMITDTSQGNVRNIFEWRGLQIRPVNGGNLTAGDLTVRGSSGISFASNTVLAGRLQMVPGVPFHSVLILPGQTFNNGSLPSGAPTPIMAGQQYIHKIVVTDQFYNTATSYSGTRSLSFSGAATNCGSGMPLFPLVANFINGVSSDVAVTLVKAEKLTLSAKVENFDGVPSSLFAVDAATTGKYAIVLPGQTYAECQGPVGNPVNQTQNIAFAIPEVRLVDSMFNTVSTFSATKTITWRGASGSSTITNTITFRGGVSVDPPIVKLTVAELLNLIANDSSYGGLASASFTVVSNLSQFDAFESTTSLGSIYGVIKTKVAGVPFSLDLIAKNSDGTAIDPNFVGTLKVQIVDSYDTSKNCSNYPTEVTLLDQSFSASDKGRHRVNNIVVGKAWRNLRVRLIHDNNGISKVTCSADNFAVRPSSFTGVDVTGTDSSNPAISRSLTNGSSTFRAGQTFTVRATPSDAAGSALQGYTGTPVLTISECGAACADSPHLGSYSYDTPLNTNGSVVVNNVRYHETGHAVVLIKDTTFANVDIADSSDAERHFSSTTLKIGRFIPDHFAVSTVLTTPRTDVIACGSSTFTYIGEPFVLSFTLTAISAGNDGQTTRNYGNSANALSISNPSSFRFGLLDSSPDSKMVTVPIDQIIKGSVITTIVTKTPHVLVSGMQVFISGLGGYPTINNLSFTVKVLSTTSFTIDANTSASMSSSVEGSISRLAGKSITGSWNDGRAHVNAELILTRGNIPTGPHRITAVGMAPIDVDGVTLAQTEYDLDSDLDNINDRKALYRTEYRFGLLKLDSVYSAGLSHTDIPISVLYWNKQNFILNNDDSCTPISISSLNLNNYQGSLSSSIFPTPALSVVKPIKNGSGKIRLNKPTATLAGKGSLDLQINLDIDNKQYLQNRGNSTTFSNNPKARITLGNYKKSPLIYMQENF